MRHRQGRRERPHAVSYRAAGRIAAAGFLMLAAIAAPVAAGDHPPIAARAGLDVAAVAARAWAPDAMLVYVENDEALDPAGTSPRWGYLFFSPQADKARVYSVRGERILVAEYLDMKFEAPPLDPVWFDSGAALEAAERGGGRNFRKDFEGRLDTMLLMRGAFLEGDPDETTWTLIYTSPRAPSLFVVVGASDGKVRRTWRG
jgi:hypothetical protein